MLYPSADPECPDPRKGKPHSAVVDALRHGRPGSPRAGLCVVRSQEEYEARLRTGHQFAPTLVGLERQTAVRQVLARGYRPKVVQATTESVSTTRTHAGSGSSWMKTTWLFGQAPGNPRLHIFHCRRRVMRRRLCQHLQSLPEPAPSFSSPGGTTTSANASAVAADALRQRRVPCREIALGLINPTQAHREIVFHSCPHGGQLHEHHGALGPALRQLPERTDLPLVARSCRIAEV